MPWEKAKQPGAGGLPLIATTSKWSSLRARGHGSEHVAVHDPKREEAEQREEDEDERPRARVDDPVVAGAFLGVRLGDVPPASVEPGPQRQPDRCPQDDQKKSHNPKEEAWTPSGSASALPKTTRCRRNLNNSALQIHNPGGPRPPILVLGTAFSWRGSTAAAPVLDRPLHGTGGRPICSYCPPG